MVQNVCFKNINIFQISESFEQLKDSAIKDLGKHLSSAKLKELSEFALFVETNRESDKRICIGKKSLITRKSTHQKQHYCLHAITDK